MVFNYFFIISLIIYTLLVLLILILNLINSFVDKMSSFNTQTVDLPMSSNKKEDSNETISDSGYSSNSLNNKQPNLSSSNYNRGRWTLEEHKKFIEGLIKYGSFWKFIQKNITTRSPAQVRSHAQKFFLMCKKKIVKNSGDIMVNKSKIKEIFFNYFDKANIEDEQFYETIWELVNNFEMKSQTEKKSEKIFKIEKKTKKQNKGNNKLYKLSQATNDIYNNSDCQCIVDRNDDNDDIENDLMLIYNNGRNGKGKGNVNGNEVELEKKMNPFNLIFDSIAFSTNDNVQNLLDINDSIDKDNFNENNEWD